MAIDSFDSHDTEAVLGENEDFISSESGEYWETKSRYPYMELMAYFLTASMCVLCPKCCSNAFESCLEGIFDVCPERPGDLERFDNAIFNPLGTSDDSTLVAGERGSQESERFRANPASDTRRPPSSRLLVTTKKKKRKKKKKRELDGDERERGSRGM